MQVQLSKNIVISLVTGLVFGLSVALFAFHLTCSTNQSRRPPYYNQKTSVNRDEDLDAGEMVEQVRVLCWIMTQPQNHKIKVNKPLQGMAPTECP